MAQGKLGSQCKHFFEMNDDFIKRSKTSSLMRKITALFATN
jgi:hypothetical protein